MSQTPGGPTAVDDGFARGEGAHEGLGSVLSLWDEGVLPTKIREASEVPVG